MKKKLKILEKKIPPKGLDKISKKTKNKPTKKRK